MLCDASYKTIQNEIKSLNSKLEKRGLRAKIVTQRGIGVIIESAARDELKNIIDYLNESDNEIPDYNKEYYILKIGFMLLQNDYLKIDDICDTLALSRSVINELLNNTKQIFQKWEIKVSSKPHYGLYINGLESDIQSVIAIIRNFDVLIDDSILEQLLLYVKVMTIRLLNNKTIDDDKLHLEKSSFEYILSEKIILLIESYSNSIVSKNDVNWIYRFIKGKCLKKTESDLQINHEIMERILPHAIAMIEDKYSYNFAHDIDLYTSMLIHLNALAKRAEIDNYLINPMLHEIKTYSLLAYDMATDVSILINEVLNVKLPDDEISYFAIHLHLAIERQKQQVIPRNALVVGPSGKGMSEMVAQYIRKQFGEYISKLKTCSYYDLDHIDYSQYDYIFAMKPLNINVPLPVIVFSLNSDKYSIEKTKMQIWGKKNKEFILAPLTPASLFFNDIDADSKEDALKKLIKRSIYAA